MATASTGLERCVAIGGDTVAVRRFINQMWHLELRMAILRMWGGRRVSPLKSGMGNIASAGDNHSVRSRTFVCVCAEIPVRRAIFGALEATDVVYTTMPDESHVIVVSAATDAAACTVRQIFCAAESMTCTFIEE